MTKGFKWHLSHAIEVRATHPPRRFLTWLNGGYQEMAIPLIQRSRQIIRRSNCSQKNGCSCQAASSFFLVSLKVSKWSRVAYSFKNGGYIPLSPVKGGLDLATRQAKPFGGFLPIQFWEQRSSGILKVNDFGGDQGTLAGKIRHSGHQPAVGLLAHPTGESWRRCDRIHSRLVAAETNRENSAASRYGRGGSGFQTCARSDRPL